MKHSAKQYAAALLGALEGKSEAKQEEIIKQFLQVLTKNNDWAKLNSVVKETEKGYLKKEGLKKVYVETVDHDTGDLKKEIVEILGKKVHFVAKTNSKLLAGVKILVDDEILIDASAKRKLDNIFS